MKSYDAMRAEAREKMREGGWVRRFVGLWLVVMLIGALVQGCLFQARLALGQLTTPFEVFFSCVLNGLLSFALASLFLRAAKGEQRDWLAPSFGGFKCPLGVAWLYFRYALQVTLWSLLFVIPGVIAIYRYCQCWNLKVEHPDWSAGECLAESGRIMKGQKWRRFAFDCSYWRPITLVMLGLLGVTVFSVLPVIPVVGRRIDMLLIFLLGLATCWGSIILTVYMSIGQALFYLDVKGV